MNDDPNDPLNKIKPKPKAQTRPQPSGRPTIVIMPGETERVVDEIEAVLIAAGRSLYKRGGLIVSPGVDRRKQRVSPFMRSGQPCSVRLLPAAGDDVEKAPTPPEISSLGRGRQHAVDFNWRCAA